MFAHPRVDNRQILLAPHYLDTPQDRNVKLFRYVVRGLTVVVSEVSVATADNPDHEVSVLVEECLHRLGCESSARLVICRSH